MAATGTPMTTNAKTKLGRALLARAELLGHSDDETTAEINRIAIDVLHLPERMPHVHPRRKHLDGPDRLKTIDERTADFRKTRDGIRYWKRDRKPGEAIGIDVEMLPALAVYLGWTLQRTFMAYLDDMLRHSGGIDDLATLVDSYAETEPVNDQNAELLKLQRALDALADHMEQVAQLSCEVAGRKAKLVASSS